MVHAGEGDTDKDKRIVKILKEVILTFLEATHMVSFIKKIKHLLKTGGN